MLTLIIFIATSLLIIVGFLFFPSLKIGKLKLETFWNIAVLGALLVLLTGQVTLNEIGANLFAKTAMNPIKLVTLFLSMAVLSIYLDEVGFFSYLAALVLKKAGTSQWKLFFSLYILVSLLTLFTSNDIIVLTLTLFIIYFCKRANINPLPYLIAQFVAANTASIAFIIGNPTNMYLASAFNLSFIEYFLVMGFPALAVVSSALIVLVLIFYKDLSKKIEPLDLSIPSIRKAPIIVGLSHLFITIVLLVISNYINLEMWLITLALAISLILFSFAIKTKKEIQNTIKRLPYNFIPFLISMFILVLGLSKSAFNGEVVELLAKITPIESYGYSSVLFANLINNIPMSVLYASLIKGVEATNMLSATYASIIGSNVAAVFTPLGSLAGLMWMQLLKKEGVNLTFGGFMKWGLLVGFGALTCGLLALNIVL